MIPIIPAVPRSVNSDCVPCCVRGRRPDHSRIETVVLGTRTPSPAESTGQDDGWTDLYALWWLRTFGEACMKNHRHGAGSGGSDTWGVCCIAVTIGPITSAKPGASCSLAARISQFGNRKPIRNAFGIYPRDLTNVPTPIVLGASCITPSR